MTIFIKFIGIRVRNLDVLAMDRNIIQYAQSNAISRDVSAENLAQVPNDGVDIESVKGKLPRKNSSICIKLF